MLLFRYRNHPIPILPVTESRLDVADRLLFIKDVADRLGRSEAQLRWMLHQGTGPKSAMIGGRRMFREPDVEAFIDAAFEEAS